MGEGNFKMTLKEKILNRKRTITKQDRDNYLQTKDAKDYDLFLNICERVVATIDCSKLKCDTYSEVFDIIDTYHISVFDIVSEQEWNDFKNSMLNSKTQCCPTLGREPNKIYDLTNVEDYMEYSKMRNMD